MNINQHQAATMQEMFQGRSAEDTPEEAANDPDAKNYYYPGDLTGTLNLVNSDCGGRPCTQADLQRSPYYRCDQMYPATARRNPNIDLAYKTCYQNVINQQKAQGQAWLRAHPQAPGKDDDSPCAAILDNWRNFPIPANFNPQQYYQSRITELNKRIRDYSGGNTVANSQCNQRIAEVDRIYGQYRGTSNQFIYDFQMREAQGLCGQQGEVYGGLVLQTRQELDDAMQLGPILLSKKHLASQASHQCNVSTGRWGAKQAEAAAFKKMAAEHIWKTRNLPEQNPDSGSDRD